MPGVPLFYFINTFLAHRDIFRQNNFDMLTLEPVSYLCPNSATTGIDINVKANANAKLPPPLVR